MLTKDNLIKRKWQGNKTCCFCHEDETIQHLFIDCRFARSVWSVAHIALNLAKPQSILHMFGSWLYGVKKELRSLVLLGVGVIAWSIWLHRNDIVFEKKNYSPLQVILCRYPPTPFLVYSPAIGYVGYSCSGLAAVGAGGEGLLFPDVWVAV